MDQVQVPFCDITHVPLTSSADQARIENLVETLQCRRNHHSRSGQELPFENRSDSMSSYAHTHELIKLLWLVQHDEVPCAFDAQNYHIRRVNAICAQSH